MIRKANIDDLDTIMVLIENGRNHIKQYNIEQWTNGYPSRELILEDINNDRAYIFMDNDEISGYFVIINYDPCYDMIDGKWISDRPYVAVHRTVTKTYNSGLGTKMLNEIKKKYNHIRVDTHEGNISMNKCLLKNNFIYCGVIHLKDGNPRNAYEFIEEEK